MRVPSPSSRSDSQQLGNSDTNAALKDAMGLCWYFGRHFGQRTGGCESRDRTAGSLGRVLGAASVCLAVSCGGPWIASTVFMLPCWSDGSVYVFEESARGPVLAMAIETNGYTKIGDAQGVRTRGGTRSYGVSGFSGWLRRCSVTGGDATSVARQRRRAAWRRDCATNDGHRVIFSDTWVAVETRRGRKRGRSRSRPRDARP